MKKTSFVAVAAVFLCGCMERESRSSGSGSMFRVHWAGASKLPAGTNAFAKVLALQATSRLRSEAFLKLARTPEGLWKKSLPAGAADQSTQLRPLFDDLWNYESVVELRGSPERPDLVVAVQLDDARAELWNKNLRAVAAGWKLNPEKALTLNAAKGWSAAGRNLNIHYARSGKWSLAAIAHDSQIPFEAQLKSDRPTPALASNIVEIHLDWPRLNRAFPLLANYSLPPMDIKVSQRGESLRTEGKFVYSDRLPIKFEPWKVATNVVMEPIISFTCAQGIAPLLNQVKGFSNLRLKNPPNQVCMWARANVPVQTFLTVPMADPTNVVKEIVSRLPDLVKAHFTNAPGKFLWISNRAEWIWSGLPLFIPHLHPQKEPNGEFLFAGLFPQGQKSNAAPAELFGQVIGRTNLVYYDWELTQERLSQVRHMAQLLDIINRRRLPTTNSVGFQWLREIEPLLGNSITEVALSSPKELSIVRKSAIGFTGFELTVLSRWIESAGFPLRYEPPPPLDFGTNRPAIHKKPPP
jgi:hypothetical protein